MIGALANHLWQCTLFTVVLAVMSVAFRQNGAHVRYWLWFAASFKFLVPFSLLLNAGSLLRWSGVGTDISPLTRAASQVIVRAAQPFPGPESGSLASPATVDPVHAFLFAVWLGGFGAVTFIRWRGWRHIQSTVRSSSPLYGMCSFAARHAEIQLRSSSGLLEPTVAGLWRPLVLLPHDLEECLSESQLRAVLAHELCHVRRRDNLTAAVHMVVEAIFWFHPLVWWIGTQLLKERERACDEYVLQTIGEPRTYAEAILAVCKRYVESPLACAPGVTASNIRDRIEDIMNNRIGVRLSNPKRAAVAVGVAIALGIPFTARMWTTPLQAQSVKRSTDPTALISTKETVLKYSLFKMREAIDKYLDEKKQYPSSLPQLVSEGYISQVPTDPFTDRFDSWKTVLKRPADYPDAPVGIHDVSSGSNATALDSTKYSTW